MSYTLAESENPLPPTLFGITGIAHMWLDRRKWNVLARSIVGAIVLALRVQDALPVVSLICLLRVGVYLHLDVTSKEARAALEDGKVLLLNHEPGERAEDRWRDTPIDEIAREDIERRAMQWANDRVPNDVSTLAHGCPEMRAKVADGEHRAGFSLAYKHINTCQVDGPQLGGREIAGLETDLQPCERWQDE